MTPGGTRGRYIPELDGLRALAIGLVMVYHFWRYSGDSPVGLAINRVAAAGWAGVDVFFVLSGFLITRILIDLRDHQRRWRTFYIRRSLRIFPLYYAVLTVLLVAGLLLEIDDPNLAGIDNIWVNYLYASNVSLAVHGSHWAPLDISWSLAVEEQFYLIYPFVVWAVSDRRLLRVLVAAVVVAALFRATVFVASGENMRTAYTLPLSRMDQLAMGGIACLLLRSHPDALRRWARRLALPLTAIAAALLLTMRREDLGFVVAGYSATGAAAATVMIAVLSGGAGPLSWVLRRRPLVWVGKVSYGLYLLHLFAAAALSRSPLAATFNGGGLGIAFARVALLAAVACVLAWLSWNLFERPILRLKERFAAY